jgi:chemotaxis protein CheX
MNSANPALSGGRVETFHREEWGPLMKVAAREVFELMLGSTLTTQETVAEGGLSITSMVGLAGKLCGVMSVRCGPEAAMKMTSRMLGVDVNHAGPEMSDALGEVCNMVAGNFKNKISSLGDGCMLSVPTVIIGSDYSVRSLADSPAVQVSFLFENLPIVISLQMHS